MKFLMVFLFVLLISCAGDAFERHVKIDDGSTDNQNTQKKLTVMVYMPADNDLEADAIRNINEMEAANFSNDINIVVLFDRINEGDSSNGNWHSTKLFKIVKDVNGLNNNIISTEIGSTNLGLSVGVDTELDMGNSSTLEYFIAGAKNLFPAEKYALIISGHSNGWYQNSLDKTNNSYMLISEMGAVLRKNKVDIIGLDTPFGALLEVAYELKDSGATYLIASEGQIPKGGWDYQNIFDKLNIYSNIDNISDSIFDSFSALYASTNNDISIIDLAQINNLFIAFNSFSNELIAKITSDTIRKNIQTEITSRVQKYVGSSGDTGSIFLDIKDLNTKLTTLLSMNNTISTTLNNSIDNSIKRKFKGLASNNSNGIAVYYSDLKNNVADVVNDKYFKGSAAAKPLFIDASSWSPKQPSGGIQTPDLGALYWIIYSTFNP